MKQYDMFPESSIMTNGSEQEIMRPSEVAEYLRVGKNTVYALLETGALPGFRVNGNGPWLVPKEGVNIYIRQRSGLI